jgi:protein-S-isoprenylcysteine O-methyltransferase Ste14
MVALGRFLFRHRGTVFTAIMVGALLLASPRYLLEQRELDIWMDVAGVLVAFAGLSVRAATIGFEYIVRGGRNRQVYADRLVQGGIYSHTRNPMYLGNGLIVLGAALILHAPQFYAVVVPLTVLFYAAIIAAEEAYLRDKFGAEFDDYCRRVNRILPRLAGLRRTIADMHFNWRRVLVKEYNTMFLAALGLTVLVIWDDYLIQGEAALPAVEHCLAFVGTWVALYLAVYWLKKSRRLEADPPPGGTSA